MKYYISLFMALLLNVTVCYAATSKYAHNLNTIESINCYENVSFDDIKQVAKHYVPSKYQDSFFKFTECETEEETKDLVIQILAIGYWESGWKILKSDKNSNGTYDLGYLALNTANINNKDFMSNFGIEEDYVTVDDTELYLIVCINFYKYLYTLYGADAAYCYNCGEGRYINMNIPSSTYRYTRRINECVGKFIYESEKIANERIEKEEEFKEFIDGLDHSLANVIVKFNNPYSPSRLNNIGTMGSHRNYIYVETTVFIYKNKKEDLDAAFEEFGKPNKDFVCIGYIRKYGNLVAPVFRNIKTGEKFIC